MPELLAFLRTLATFAALLEMLRKLNFIPNVARFLTATRAAGRAVDRFLSPPKKPKARWKIARRVAEWGMVFSSYSMALLLLGYFVLILAIWIVTPDVPTVTSVVVVTYATACAYMARKLREQGDYGLDRLRY